MERTIICIDMDAFFASVEQQTNPRLKGKPIAVIGSGQRTVITTSSYEARQYGVKTGMNVYEARKLCPGLIFVVGDNRKYTHTCRELGLIYCQFTPDVEIYSIDEAFLDVTGTEHLFGGAEAIGRSLKRLIKDRFGINCTVGIGPNILIAKLASDLAKPDGLMRVPQDRVGPLLEGLPVKKLWGIGRHTEEKLKTMGIVTCGDLGRAPVSVLRRRFGIIGEGLKVMGMGIWARPVAVREEDPKSIGHGMTLPRDIYIREDMEMYILQLSEMVGRRARQYGHTGRRVSLTLRYTDFHTFTKQTTLHSHTNDTRDIFRSALSILDTIRLRDRVRLIGVRLSHLVRETGQMTLFPDGARRKSLIEAMDMVNNRYGEHRLMWGSYLRRLESPRVISPAWRPSGVKNIEVK
ncbi:MAG: DNA polymerase IV [Syntrophus sp. (in: bacteria)]|nr:DNA polymerase IV [Syntrophus sp. (in: bacteria)]